MSDMIFAVLTGIISVILFIYVFFAVRGKGPIYPIHICLLPKRKGIKQIKSGIPFGFGRLWDICLYIVFTLLVCVIVYAVKENIKSEKTDKSQSGEIEEI